MSQEAIVMKLRAPPGCTKVSHGGCVLFVDAEGSLETDEATARALAAHGFLPWQEPQPPEADAQEADFVERLNRSALFALLRDRGVRVALPVTNAQLRAAAKRALAERM
jgi:hypothetical protein